MEIENIKIWLSAKNLDKKKGFFAKSGLDSYNAQLSSLCYPILTSFIQDPYLVIQNHEGTIIAKSEIVFSNIEPTWSPFHIDVQECGGKFLVTTQQIHIRPLKPTQTHSK
jgi:hypothetical protein